ncbi:WD40/YVTN/BNR-like repeat-containing protein [Alicyclobacillus acidoterrestris]|uniref:WD40/YVTN/BNR-like repeat-containing protein n=1 Tax=Alicyclobacillus acidoterrestris TaxID=1450 RepID=UPI003F53A0B8
MQFAPLQRVACSCLLIFCLAGCTTPFARSTPASVTSKPDHSAAEQSTDTSAAQGNPLTATSSGDATFEDRLHLRDAHLQMLDTSKGFAWGYVGHTFKLYKTTDGCVTWQNIAPPAIPSYDVSSLGPGNIGYTDAYFIGTANGYLGALAFMQADGVHVLTSTETDDSHDSHLWHKVVVPSPGDATHIGQICFTTPKYGWMLLLGDGASGAAPKYLYRTTNGGMTWQEVNSSTAALPHNGVDVDMTFSQDGVHGILTTVDPLTHSPIVEETSDGGRHWQTVLDSLTGIHLTDSVTDVTPFTPTLENGMEHAEFFVESPDGDKLLMIAKEMKGGLISHTLSVSNVQALTWSESAATVVSRKDDRDIVMHSDDDGQDWRTVGSIPDSLADDTTTVQDFQMFGQVGWLLLQNDTLTPTLLKTTDGGAHWTTV